MELERHWDARWTEAEQDDAVREADDQARQAEAAVHRAIREVEAATRVYSDALKWTVSIRTMRGRA